MGLWLGAPFLTRWMASSSAARDGLLTFGLSVDINYYISRWPICGLSARLGRRKDNVDDGIFAE